MTTDFKYHYHDSSLVQFVIGPRKDLNLIIHLDPIWNEGIDKNVSLSFRGIENLEKVKTFFTDKFSSRITPNAYLARIEELKKTGKNSYLVEFDYFGQMTIDCKGHLESVQNET